MEFLKTNFTTQEFMSALLSDEQVAQSMLKILVERSDFEKRFMKICTSKETSGSNPAMHLFDFLLTAEGENIQSNPIIRIDIPYFLFTNSIQLSYGFRKCSMVAIPRSRLTKHYFGKRC